MMEQERLLKAAFLAGAITDALAVLPMLVPELARSFGDSTISPKIKWGHT